MNGHLWRRGQVGALFLGNALGGLVLVLAWSQAARKVVPLQQLDSIDFAIAAVVLALTSNVLFLLAGLRALRHRRRTFVENAVAGVRGGRIGNPARPARAGRPPAPDAMTSAGTDVFVTAAGMARYHRPECLLAAGKALEHHPRAVHERHGRRPCGVCAP